MDRDQTIQTSMDIADGVDTLTGCRARGRDEINHQETT